MALIGNGVRLIQNPNRALFTPSVHNEIYNQTVPCLKRSSSGAFSKYSAMPRGYYAPEAWLIPQKARDIASRNLTIDTISGSGNGAMGKNGVGTSSATLSASAVGQLIAKAIGTTSVTMTAEALLIAVLFAEASASFEIDADALWTALGWVSADADLELSGGLQSYASGKLEGVANLAGEPTMDVNYGGNVFVSEWGTDSTVYPAGTATHPVKTLACADTLSSKYNLRTYYVQGTHTITKEYDHTRFVGWGSLSHCIIVLDGDYLLDEVKFTDLIVMGKQNAYFPPFGFTANLGTVQYNSCYLYDIEDLAGNFRDCQFAGDIKIKAGKWISATNSIIEGDTTFFDLGGVTGTTISMDITSGWFQLLNSADGCLTELNLKGGEVSFDSSNTGGEYYLEGIGTFFDESTGMTCKENHLTWDEPIAYHTIVGSTGKALNDSGSAGNPWGADATSNNDPGTMGEQLNKALKKGQFIALK